MNNLLFHQDANVNSFPLAGIAEAVDLFGSSLSAGDFNGDGASDLSIGVVGEDINSVFDAGAVNTVYGSTMGLSGAGNQLWSQDTVGVANTPNFSDNFGSSLAAGDFDGDGRDDLAVGVIGENIASAANAGAVNVLYGSPVGLQTTGAQLWSQDSAGIQGLSETDDSFGSSLTTGDFNGDGRDDLAVGVSGEDIGSVNNAGAVNVLYGSNAGLQATGAQLWSQNSAGVPDVAGTSDFFGSSLAAGDFDGDGRDDLAVGVSGEDIGSVNNAGAVNVLYGSNAGLQATGAQLWSQNSAGVQGVSEAFDSFGSSLGVGDFNGDGNDDLAVGVSGESIGSALSAGAVNVLYGSNTGLQTTGTQLWSQDSAGVLGVAETSDSFGSVLAVGDFNGDGNDDLAVGVEGEDIGSNLDAGAVNIIYGSVTGLNANNNQLWHQNSPGIIGMAEAFDRFGSSLTSGDFNNDGFMDLAIGITGEGSATISSAGAVQILYGSNNGLHA